MILNEVRIKSKEIAKKYNITVFEALQRFMFERILERISVSQYKNNFILKGGILLSAMMGIENRTTKDIDTTIKGIDISKENMLEILNEILNINLNDGVKFDIINIKNIREEDVYGGSRYDIVCHYGEMKINLSIDISTGDIITPRVLKYGYNLIFENRKIFISSYNLETILSKKIETILRRGKNNSRMKDFYDVYFFITNFLNDIDIKLLNKAIKNTFQNRKANNLLSDYNQILNGMLNSELLQITWKRYQIRYNYAKDIEINSIIVKLKEFLSEIIEVPEFS